MISPVRFIDLLVLLSLGIAHISSVLILFDLNVLCF